MAQTPPLQAGFYNLSLGPEYPPGNDTFSRFQPIYMEIELVADLI